MAPFCCCQVTNSASAAQPAKNLKVQSIRVDVVLLHLLELYCQAALLEAEQGNEPVDGGLLGMAAAQARVSHCRCQLLNFPA